MSEARDRGAIGFAERVLTLLDQGAFSSTYKYAVLIGLIDLCMIKCKRNGSAPDVITTRELAEKVLQLYWPQVNLHQGKYLRQNNTKQARILSDILEFTAHLPDPSMTREQARIHDATGYNRLVCAVEWTIIHMPLPKLQVLPGRPEPFIYRINWDDTIERKPGLIRQYQRGAGGRFDNRILLLPDVGNYLVMLNGLLRPLIYRSWSAMVASFNGLQESKLEEFLFGIDRISLESVKPGLIELQDNRCFYCSARMSSKVEVDHFIPWARHPNNAIENLVATDKECNADKKAFLASGEHLQKWAVRMRHGSSSARFMSDIADIKRWERNAEESMAVARSIYLRLPAGANLWSGRGRFSIAEPELLKTTFATG